MLVAVIINQLIFSFIKLPFSWGNFYGKEQCLEKNAAQYNTVLMGSSRVFRQINPEYFDSLNQNINSTHTFNFGIDAMTIPELHYEFENILRIKNLHAKYILVELCDVDTFDAVNLHTLRKKYYYSTSTYFTSLKSLWQSAYPVYRKVAGSMAHTINWMECVLHFNSLNEVMPFKQNQQHSHVVCGNFFVPLQNNDTTLNFVLQGKTTNPHLELLKHTDQLNVLHRNTQEIFRTTESVGKLNETYSTIAKQMIDEGKEFGVTVIFVLPPKLEETHYRNVIPVFKSLPAENRIDIGDPYNYPQFYELRYAYDLGHVNVEGARLYTQAMSSTFLQLTQSK